MKTPLRACCATLITVLATIAGCGGSPDVPDTADSEKHGYSVGVSQPALEELFQQQIKADIAAAADREADLDVIFKEAKGDSARQQKQVREFIRQDVDLIILYPSDSAALTAPVTEAMAAGIPVLLLHRGVVGVGYTCLLRADDEQIGAAAARWIFARLGDRGQIVQLKGASSSTPADARSRGFRSARSALGFRVVFEAEMDWRQKDARAAMAEALSHHRRIDAVFAHNDLGAYGAYLAAKDAGREKEIIFVGIGALPQEGMARLEEGVLDATFEFPTGGAEAIDAANKILGGQQVPKNITLASRYFTKENSDRGGEPIE